ncbi:Fpg/Nei family DNA glycosylase [Stratiformator vulcanicus]|uniref:DNA-(apurinic or apyrimidinic site) lyase n=1 Tax=Stratiformator vulcanicus TaxID=2527980 RepID=A0A517R7M7_9PLAN|nr:DNA glycosylase [Stratiformator vulcanicus]QDT39875.1 Endonuclease 8 1 [Stratiformator vulcanicus]
MPEGHKTHFVAQQHRERFSGQAIKVSSPQGRFRTDARKVDGRELADVNAVGKHLFYDFGDEAPGRFVHVHLGRYGKFREHELPLPQPKGQVRMRFVGRDVGFDLTGPTACRVIDEREHERVCKRLGPDPLDPKADADLAFAKISKSKKELGALLLDQSVIAGTGNIFRAEILFELRLDPTRPGNSLTRSEFDKLWKTTVRLMKVGLKYDRIITVSRAEAGKPLSQLANDERFRVYKQPRCLSCGSEIVQWEQGGRQMFGCGICQGFSLD